jgi:hypothetical protein
MGKALRKKAVLYRFIHLRTVWNARTAKKHSQIRNASGFQSNQQWKPFTRPRKWEKRFEKRLFYTDLSICVRFGMLGRPKSTHKLEMRVVFNRISSGNHSHTPEKGKKPLEIDLNIHFYPFVNGLGVRGSPKAFINWKCEWFSIEWAEETIHTLQKKEIGNSILAIT